MTSLPPDAWVPVPVRWRHVQPGDLVLAGATPWLITHVQDDGTVVGQHTFRERHHARPDPDDVAQVLVPVTEREAVELAREQLGARLVERRTT